MFIEKVHGLQATSLTLNDRFTILSTVMPEWVAPRPRRRSVSSIFNYNNRALIEQIARRLEQQSKRLGLKQRMGIPGNLRRFGSESSLPGLIRSNSFGNLSQQSVKNRVSWRQSNGNLSRSGSLGTMGGNRLGRPIRFRRRGGGQRALRGRFRGGRQNQGRVTRLTQNGRREGARTGEQLGQNGPAGQPRRGMRMRGRGRGGLNRNQQLPTKEELDQQLDQYMAGTKAALDQELENYMKNAMDLE